MSAGRTVNEIMNDKIKEITGTSLKPFEVATGTATMDLSDTSGSYAPLGCLPSDNLTYRDYNWSTKITITEETGVAVNRIVDIYVVDTDEDLPVSRRLVKAVKDTFTDESDDALKMTLNIDIDAHNKVRADYKDDDDRPLKPVRISDLVVRIVERARF